jgi:hypothetical protein
MDEMRDASKLDAKTRLDEEMTSANNMMGLIVVLTLIGGVVIAGVAAILGAL